MHTHTLASTHAYSTITENAAWCSEHGIKYLGMTDHGIAMQDSPDTWHFENLRILPEYLKGVRVFKGIEADILLMNANILQLRYQRQYIGKRNIRSAKAEFLFIRWVLFQNPVLNLI